MSNSIFLSHSHADKPFARRLAQDLANAGVRVWIDEAEILLGDSLIEKIRAGIEEMDFLGVILSPQSVNSEWVKKEVEMALNEEIDGKRIKVLPLLYRQSEIPGFLKGKKYADFTDDENYAESFQLILQRLGITSTVSPPNEEERLETLKASYPLLAIAFNEIQNDSLSNATISAILSSSILPEDISDFWRLMAAESRDWKLFGIATAALETVEKFGVGYEVVEYCLEEDRMHTPQKDSLITYMTPMTNVSDIVWSHSLFISKIKNDFHYHTFIRKHLSVILEKCPQAMLGYLLYPNRGPDKWNLDTFFEVIKHMPDPQPLLLRWGDWIRDGYFDGNPKKPGTESAEILYTIFNEIFVQKLDKFDDLIQQNNDRVSSMLKGSFHQVEGLYHLVAMLQAKYKKADYVLENIISRVSLENFSPEEIHLFISIRSAFEALAEHNKSPWNTESVEKFTAKWFCVYEADKITGFFSGSKRFEDQE